MARPWTTSVLLTAPAAADGVSLTPSATAWAWSAWVEVIAATPAALRVGSICPTFPSIAADAEIQIGIGAAGAETPVTTYRLHVNGNVLVCNGALIHPVLLDAVPSGARVSVRLRKSGTSTVAWKVALTYYLTPVTGAMNSSSQPALCLPTGAAGLSFSLSAGAWVNSAYQQFTGALTTASVLLGVVMSNANTGVDWEVDIAVGAAGSEVVVATFRDISGNTASEAPCWYPLPVPLDVLPAGSRIAARARHASAASTSTVNGVAIVYMEKPL